MGILMLFRCCSPGGLLTLDPHADSVVKNGSLWLNWKYRCGPMLELFRPSPQTRVIGRLGDGQRVALDKADVAELVRKRITSNRPRHEIARFSGCTGCFQNLFFFIT